MPENDDEFLNRLVQTYFGGEEMPKVKVSPVKRTPQAAKTGQLAYTYTTGDPDIYVNADTPLYGKAKGGDTPAMQYLAALLAHERAHLQSGAVDESPAYDAELEFLNRIKAHPRVIKDVTKTRDQQLARQKLIWSTGKE